MTLPYSIGARVPLTTAERAYLGARAALKMLGDTRFTAEEHLLHRDVRGAYGVHTRTALAMYLQGRTGFVWLVDASTATCALRGDTVVVPLTEAARALHAAFQRGETPRLEGEASSGTAGPLSDAQLHDTWRNER